MQDTSSHEHPTDRLSEYADDELSAAERTTVERHLSGCAECRQVLAELRDVSARARGLIDTPPAADLWPGVAAAVAQQPRGRARPARRVSFTLPQLVAASLALMLLSGGMVWMARLGGERTDFPAVIGW
jgi:anti-sigma factor RsiW